MKTTAGVFAVLTKHVYFDSDGLVNQDQLMDFLRGLNDNAIVQMNDSFYRYWCAEALSDISKECL